jgi:hypothetical protein
MALSVLTLAAHHSSVRYYYDHQERMSAKEAMAHMYFTPVREAAARDGVARSAAQSSTGYAV